MWASGASTPSACAPAGRWWPVSYTHLQIAEGREKLAASIQIPASTTIFATGSYSVECQVSASGAQS